ncbi:flagellin [Novosphingobium sp. M1R2S20]|uniref:Flagellin n=1 Tax=Novosphingobium rhizovicinum TaxID=3228928 RepID=A0ABV3R9T5_9SPHN
MTRVASIPMQRTMLDAIQRSQQKVSATQLQLASGRKAQNYADLGTEAVRTLSAHSLLARQDAHGTVTKRLGTTLAIQDANISNIESASESMRVEMLKAVGTGQSAGLQEAIDAAFQQVRSALNADEGGLPLFAGSRTEELPFKPETLAELAGTPAAEVFGNDRIRASARVSEGLDVEFGVVASDLGSKIMEGFRTLAGLAPIGEKVSEAQISTLRDAVKQIESGLTDIRSINAENGRKQAQIEDLGVRAEDRSILLKELISRSEDADLAEVASELTMRRTVLEASYSVFSQLSGLSLVRYLN